MLGVLATFGEAVMGGTGLVYLTMAGDAENRELFAGVWEQMESSPVMLFAMVGFGGTVLTLVLLSVGLFRSRARPALGPGPGLGCSWRWSSSGRRLTEYRVVRRRAVPADRVRHPGPDRGPGPGLDTLADERVETRIG